VSGRQRLAAVLALFAAAPGAAASGDDLLPAGAGRDEVAVICDGCHSLKLVAQQGLDRDSWDETLDWMIAEQGMAALDSETRVLVLDYLAAHFGPDHRPAHVERLR